MCEYRLSPHAARDLESIWVYSANRWSVAQADRYTNALIDTLEELAANPSKGRPIDAIRPGYRKQAVGSHFIFYRQQGPDLEIIRILHQRMDVESHL